MDGTALIYCEGAFGRPEGKTANGLVRFGRRYDILGVIDSEHSGRLAGDIISGVAKAIPVFSSLHQGIEALRRRPDYLVIGFNPPDGRMPPQHRKVIRDALKNGISVDSALKPYIVDDAEFPGLTMQSSAKIRASAMMVCCGFTPRFVGMTDASATTRPCLLYTSDAADE